MRISDWSSDVCSSDLRHQIDAELALGAFSRDINLARGHMKTFGVKLEVMDERFHRLLHLATFGRHHLTVERCDRAGWHLLEALPDDAERLAHFFDAHHHQIGRASCRARVCQYV